MNDSYKYEYILLNIDKPVFHYDFHPNHPLTLGKNAEVGVRSLFMWYTYPNISEKYDNNRLRLFYKGEWQDVTIPTGMYEVRALSDYINTLFSVLVTGDEFGEVWKKSVKDEAIHYFRMVVSEASFKCKLLMRDDIKIDFSIGNLHKLLGLEPKIYERYGEGPDIINITRGVDRILFRCNLVERKYQKDIRDVLYDVLPIAVPGSAIQEQIDHVEYYQCKDEQIRRIEIRVTDKDNNPIILLEPISLKILFRYTA